MIKLFTLQLESTMSSSLLELNLLALWSFFGVPFIQSFENKAFNFSGALRKNCPSFNQWFLSSNYRFESWHSKKVVSGKIPFFISNRFSIIVVQRNQTLQLITIIFAFLVCNNFFSEKNPKQGIYYSRKDFFGRLTAQILLSHIVDICSMKLFWKLLFSQKNQRFYRSLRSDKIYK